MDRFRLSTAARRESACCTGACKYRAERAPHAMISQGIIVVLRDHETPTPYVELWVGRVRDHGRFGDDSFINRDD